MCIIADGKSSVGLSLKTSNYIRLMCAIFQAIEPFTWSHGTIDAEPDIPLANFNGGPSTLPSRTPREYGYTYYCTHECRGCFFHYVLDFLIALLS